MNVVTHPSPNMKGGLIITTHILFFYAIIYPCSILNTGIHVVYTSLLLSVRPRRWRILYLRRPKCEKCPFSFMEKPFSQVWVGSCIQNAYVCIMAHVEDRMFPVPMVTSTRAEMEHAETNRIHTDVFYPKNNEDHPNRTLSGNFHSAWWTGMWDYTIIRHPKYDAPLKELSYCCHVSYVCYAHLHWVKCHGSVFTKMRYNKFP